MIRFYNGRILQFAGGLRVTEDREVWVDGNSICYVGPSREDMPDFDRQIDLKGDLTEASKYMSGLLRIKGSVLPLTEEKVG